MEIPFSSSEEKFLLNWLDSFQIPAKILEDRLRSYLSRFYPTTRKNHLLQILEKKNSAN